MRARRRRTYAPQATPASRARGSGERERARARAAAGARQLFGRKRVELFPPSESAALYPFAAAAGPPRTSRIHLARAVGGCPDQRARFPLFPGVRGALRVPPPPTHTHMHTHARTHARTHTHTPAPWPGPGRRGCRPARSCGQR